MHPLFVFISMIALLRVEMLLSYLMRHLLLLVRRLCCQILDQLEVMVGGPSWTVKLGRRDSTTASHTLAETDLPGPFDPLDRIIPGFANKGPSARDMIALSAIAAIFSLLLLSSMQCHAQISSTFYDLTCPNALNTIRTSVRQAVSAERRMAASLIRLHFHDCFGCDASILLDETPTIVSEKTALPNLGSARGYGIIEDAKRELEKTCPGVVSCADILAVAARDASTLVGGPSWTVKLGRRDSTTASHTLAETDLPGPFDPLDRIISGFANKGLSTRDMVALSGAHSIGQAQCFLFRDRIYSNGTDIDAGFASTRRRQCPQEDQNGNLAPLDLVTPNQLDNNYYKNLIERKGLLQSDQVLLSGGSTDSIVSEYSNSSRTFASDFAAAMIKMGDISPLTGQNGIIRTVCGSIN
ncbi:Peroxidase 4 [Capsicum annuum]|uniref:Peroxidase n=1 Tax=Capsicum annuum TaxID=4072 RepID=A0A2G2ZGP7_CAPAN|nr:Peroxidase 4 [Capsicum annuum]